MNKTNQIFLALLLVIFTLSCANQTSKKNNEEEPKTFISQRKNHRTKLIPNSFVSDGDIPIPPDSIFRIVKYQSDVGLLDAYLSTGIDSTKTYPVIVWAHGGFGGIGAWFWEDQSYIESFINSELIVFCPSWRGENNNPGNFELFYGEVNDLTNAIDYLASLDFVDTNRIYLAGHSTGGTLAMLASMMSDKIRATFPLGGAPDIKAVVSNGYGYGNTPYNYKSRKESKLRSAINYVEDLNNPVVYFEGEDSSYPPYAKKMEVKAKKVNIPFKAFIIPNGNHFNIVRPINELILEKIEADTSSELNINFTLAEIQDKMENIYY